MKWLFILLFPFISYSQTLKPGVYWDLKVEQPIVLDTGSYTFIGLVFAPPLRGGWEGPWLDGSMASSLTLINCRFEGNGIGTAVISNGNAQIVKSIFTNMETGIQVLAQAATTKTLNIAGNTFTDMHTAISLSNTSVGVNEADVATLDFTLKCNTFNHSPQTGPNPITRKGLVIGEGVAFQYTDQTDLIDNSIGGNHEFGSGRQYPNANVWPTAQEDRGERTVILGIEQNLHDPDPAKGWPNSPNWVAIDNKTGTSINYIRYNNEFVGWGPAISGDVPFFYPANSSLKIATIGDGVTPGTIGYDFACGNFTDPQIVLFPARIAVIMPSLTGNKEALLLDKALLNDAVPNPSREETRIGLYIPAKAESAMLQILEATTGKVLQNIPVAERGKLEVLLDTRKAPAAIYTYRLLVDGKPVGVKKLVVQH